MARYAVDALPIVSASGHPVALLTAGDLVSWVARDWRLWITFCRAAHDQSPASPLARASSAGARMRTARAR